MRELYSGRIYDDNIDATALLNKMKEFDLKFGTKIFLISNLMMVDLECDGENGLQVEKIFIKDLTNFNKRFNV